MATTSVKVPLSGNDFEIVGWIENISQYIDAGNDVEFIDESTGSDVNISRIQLDTAGTVCIWGKGYSSSGAKAIALTAGVFHVIGGIHGIRAAGTDASKGIHVKI